MLRRFCCVGCGEMITFDQEHLVFQTGFFRVVQPLGCCKACMEGETASNAVEAERVIDPIESSIVHLPHTKPSGSGYSDSTPAASFNVHIPMVASL